MQLVTELLNFHNSNHEHRYIPGRDVNRQGCLILKIAFYSPGQHNFNLYFLIHGNNERLAIIDPIQVDLNWIHFIEDNSLSLHCILIMQMKLVKSPGSQTLMKIYTCPVYIPFTYGKEYKGFTTGKDASVVKMGSEHLEVLSPEVEFIAIFSFPYAFTGNFLSARWINRSSSSFNYWEKFTGKIMTSWARKLFSCLVRVRLPVLKPNANGMLLFPEQYQK